MKLSTKLRLRLAAVWGARIAVGATFMVSGWAKAIDPWGFIIKVSEYLAEWTLDVPYEAVVVGCVALASVEFLTGVLFATGSLKRSAAIVAAAMMTFMLPLTLYIAIYNPVADCGCFGDFIILSNWATFAKNVALTALIVYLLMRNRSVGGLYPAAIQWLVVAVSLAFPLLLSFVGYQIQPLVDFRPYRCGTEIFTGNEGTESSSYIYEKDGERRSFALDELPDSTWTFVEAYVEESDEPFGGGIAVFDRDGDDVSADIVDPDGKQLFLILPQPNMHYLVSAHYVDRLASYAERTGVDFIAIVGDNPTRLERWHDWTRPGFDVYTADPTALKQLVRGPEAVVYANEGYIRWKRTLQSMPTDLPEAISSEALDRVPVIDDGHHHLILLLIYLAALAIIYLLGLSPKALRLLSRIKRTTVH